MKKKKTLDAVRIMRQIRDRMSAEMQGMKPEEQIKYIQKELPTEFGAPRKRAAAAQ